VLSRGQAKRNDVDRQSCGQTDRKKRASPLGMATTLYGMLYGHVR
jgi:hypothetical protein